MTKRSNNIFTSFPIHFTSSTLHRPRCIIQKKTNEKQNNHSMPIKPSAYSKPSCHTIPHKNIPQKYASQIISASSLEGVIRKTSLFYLLPTPNSVSRVFFGQFKVSLWGASSPSPLSRTWLVAPGGPAGIVNSSRISEVTICYSARTNTPAFFSGAVWKLRRR